MTEVESEGHSGARDEEFEEELMRTVERAAHLEYDDEQDYAEDYNVNWTEIATNASEGRVRVVTYNVLSSYLSESEHYYRCEACDCDPDMRYGRLTAKLEAEVRRGAIVCLQEVSNDWAEMLETWFDGYGYEWTSVQYGRAFNGYMGVAIAWPSRVWTLEERICERVSNTKVDGWPGAVCPPPLEEEEEEEEESGWSWLLRAARRLLPGLDVAAEKAKKEREGERSWWAAKCRQNAMIGGVFRSKKTNSGGNEECDDANCVRFLAATYHMPCAFQTPQVMVTHGALLLQYLERRSMELKIPLVLLGDFNFQPSSPVYRLFTTGVIEPKDIPWVPEEDSWTPHLKSTVDSAYALGQGHEPDVTNFAISRSSDGLFAGVLDYIFLSPPGVWTVEGLLPLPHRSQLNVPSLPSSSEPSDHLMLAADLCLRTGASQAQ